jgi:hypothetical protein
MLCVGRREEIGAMTARIRCVFVTVLLMFGAAASAQQAPKAPDPKGSNPGKFAKPANVAKPPSQPPGAAVPAPGVLLVMVRSAMIALDHANRTGNYTVLRELGGPGLQRHSSAQLSTMFANLRNHRIDLLPTAIVTPQLTQQPSVTPEGLLLLVGFFPTQPRQIQFEVVYQPVGGEWKLFGLNVGVAAAASPAPQAAPAPQPTDDKSGAPKSGAPSSEPPPAKK